MDEISKLHYIQLPHDTMQIIIHGSEQEKLALNYIVSTLKLNCKLSPCMHSYVLEHSVLELLCKFCLCASLIINLHETLLIESLHKGY